MLKIHHCDNITFLKKEPDNKYSLIYIDPPFNTGKVQSKQTIKTIRDKEGDRVGFKGQKYKTEKIASVGYKDMFENTIKGFID